MSTIQDLRPSPIAGTWYEGDPKTLSAQVDEYLYGIQSPGIDGEILAVISPHAGHIYSGPVAGYAFAAIRDLHPDIVVIVSPDASTLPSTAADQRPRGLPHSVWGKSRSIMP